MDAANKVGPRRSSRAWIMYGPLVQSGLSFAPIALPIHPMASADRAVSDDASQVEAYMGNLTKGAHKKRYKVPVLCPDNLPSMEYCRTDKYNEKNDGGREGRVILIQGVGHGCVGNWGMGVALSEQVQVQ